MGHPLRRYHTHDTWFITTRCFQARKLMTPHVPRVREVTGGVLARAAEKYGVKLYAYAFLSNHFHLILQASGPIIADFMRYLLCNLSKKLAPLCREPWWCGFWERRYSATPILDSQALEQLVRYVVSHGVKEGLVASASDWEGLHCADQLRDEQPRSFAWYDWTRRWKQRRAIDVASAATVNDGRWADAWVDKVTLRLAPLPQWEKLTAAQRKQKAADLVAEEEARYSDRCALGAAAVREESMEAQRQRKRTPRPWCHATSQTARHDFRVEYRIFEAAFRLAARDWLRGVLTAVFPPGSFRPGLRSSVQIV